MPIRFTNDILINKTTQTDADNTLEVGGNALFNGTIKANNAIEINDVVTLQQLNTLQTSLESQIVTLDSNVVHLTGDETISGIKMFNDEVYILSDLAIQGSQYIEDGNLQIYSTTVNNLFEVKADGVGNVKYELSGDNGIIRGEVLSGSPTLTFINSSGIKTTISDTTITGPQFVKTGGLSSEFLKADGSVDSTLYADDSTVVKLSGSYSNPSWIVSLDKVKIGLSNVDNTSDLNKPISTATQTALDLKQNNLSGTGIVKSIGGTISYLTDNTSNWDTAYTYSQVGHIPLTQKGAALGVTPLDSGGKVSEIYLPDSILGQVSYQGAYDASTDTPALGTATTANKGHYYVVSVAGGIYAVGDWAISNGTSWEKVDNSDAVITVFGRLGNILALETDYESYYPKLSSSYSNPSWIASLAWSKITSTPTTLAGYGITDAYPLTGNPSGFLTSFTETDPIYTASSWYSTTNNSTNWNTAYSQTRQWDGGSTGLVVATGRTSLGLGTAALNNSGDFAAYNATTYIGTTAIALNRSSASQTLTGISIDGNAATVTNTVHSGAGDIYPTFVQSNTNGAQSIYTSGANIYYNRTNGIFYSGGGFAKTGGTSSQFLKADGSLDSNTYLTSTNGVSSITGTANQVIASGSTGAVTLSLPQSIGTASNPTFGTVTAALNGNAATATLAASATNWGGYPANFTEAATSPTEFPGYDGGTFRSVTIAGMKTALGITGGPFLPLTGGTLSGNVQSYVTVGAQINLYDADSRGLTLQSPGSGNGYVGVIGTSTNHDLHIRTGNTSRYTIDASGNNTWTGSGTFGGNVNIVGSSKVLSITDNAITNPSYNTFKAFGYDQNRFALGVSSSAGLGSQIIIDGSNNAITLSGALTGTSATLDTVGITSYGDSTQYQLNIKRSGIDNISIGSGSSYSVIQSWASKPLWINSQGNHIYFGLQSVSIDGSTGALTGTSATFRGTSTLTTLNLGTDNTHNLLLGADASYAEIQAITQGVGFDKNLILQRQGGNVGIGTTSPVSIGTGYKTLELIGENGAGIGIGKTTTSNKGYFYTDAGGVFLTSSGTIPLVFYTNGTTALTIASNQAITAASSFTATGAIFIRNNVSTASTGFGDLVFQNTYSNNYNLASITVQTGSQFYYGDIVFNTIQTGYANTLTERLRITQDGNVGIGTTSPYSILHIGSSSAAENTIILTSSGSYQHAYFGKTSTGFGFGVSSSNGSLVKQEYLSFANSTGAATFAATPILAAVPPTNSAPDYLLGRNGTTGEVQKILISNTVAGDDLNPVTGDAVNAALANKLDATSATSNTYTPTFTAGTNVTGVTGNNFRYIRVGNRVHVMGYVSGITTTTTGASIVRISFPIASAITSGLQCVGFGVCNTDNLKNAIILGDSTNDAAELQFNATVTNGTIYVSFMYDVI